MKIAAVPIEVPTPFQFTWISQEFNHFLGEEDEMTAQLLHHYSAHFFAQIHAADRVSFERSLLGAVRHHAPLQWEGRIIRPGGRLCWYTTQATPTHTPDQEIRWHGWLMDVTHFHQTEIRLRLQQEMLVEELAAAQLDQRRMAWKLRREGRKSVPNNGS